MCEYKVPVCPERPGQREVGPGGSLEVGASTGPLVSGSLWAAGYTGRRNAGLVQMSWGCWKFPGSFTAALPCPGCHTGTLTLRSGAKLQVRHSK